ncbi:MAG: FG-GAP-like repeat-containing protein [Bacteroidota bacterium]
MKKTLFILLFIACRTLPTLYGQISFSNQNALLGPVAYHSGVAIAVLDMNEDGRDDIVRMNYGFQLSVEFQTGPNQAFKHLNIGDVAGGSQWGICAADIDNNGFGDVLTGGDYDGVKIIRANADGSAYTVSKYNQPVTFVQGVNFADINNDGWLDAFVCHDDAEARIFINDGAGNLVYKNNVLNLNTVPASDNSGNYGSVWCDVDNDGDLDLYIAKCRQGVNDPTDGRRINMLFLNNGDGTYTQDIENHAGLRIGSQSWTADFGDIDNDGDFDCFITNHDVTSQVLENDGAGHFTDITVAAGMNNVITGLPIQGVFRDFDNDGFVDILVAGSAQYLFRNNGNKTFTKIANPFDNNVMESYAIGDLNGDGFQDIYASYATIYTDPTSINDVLWMNNGNGNHFFGLNLRGVQSNRNAVGARVTLYSALGTQIREVRSGESYGIMNSMQMNFGLAQETVVDSVVVRWPSGIVDKLYQPAINQYLTLQEGGCLLVPVMAYATGPTVICSGQQTQLATSPGFSAYHWNNGDTTAVATVNTAGTFSVTVTNDLGCTVVSNGVTIIVDPVETPTLAVVGDSVVCSGNLVTLTSSLSSAYVWSNGDTTQSISVGTSGNYAVTTQGLCAQFTSAPQSVTILAAPPPLATNDLVVEGNSATLLAAGDHVSWFESPDAPAVLQTGNSFITAPLSETDTFWVSNTSVYGTPNVFTGMTDHSGTELSGNTFNGQIIFDAFTPFHLYRTKVYTAKAGVRKIDLRDNIGVVLQSKSVNIPVGTTVIDLNFGVPIGTNLVLTTDESVNLANFNTQSPQLRRSDADMAYPYIVPNVLSINRSNTALGTDRYYYFYNWEIGFDSIFCESARVPVIAVVTPLIATAEPAWGSRLQLSPNPTSGVLNVALEQFEGGRLTIRVKNMQGALVNAQNIERAPGKLQWETDLSRYPQGMYLLEFQSAMGLVSRKVVVD